MGGSLTGKYVRTKLTGEEKQKKDEMHSRQFADLFGALQWKGEGKTYFILRRVVDVIETAKNIFLLRI